MSVAAVTARIDEIRGALAQLNPAPTQMVTAMPRTAAAGLSATATPDFASQLAALTSELENPATTTNRATRAARPEAATATPPAVSGASGTGTRGEQVVAEARKYLGVPYKWGGTNPAVGLDCSGLVQLVFRNQGIELPRVSYQQATAGRAVTGGLANARPGDILAFRSPVNHVGIYIGNGKMIEAPRTGLNVRVANVTETPTAIRRVLPDAPASGATAAPRAAAVSGASGVPAGTPYANLFTAAANKYGLDPKLLVAVARAESAFNPRAVSHAGAQGLMQLMPATARGLGVANPFDPPQAVDGAARLLRDLKAQFGRTDLALAAYNAGPGAVTRYGGVPPYAETRAYVAKIMTELGGNR